MLGTAACTMSLAAWNFATQFTCGAEVALATSYEMDILRLSHPPIFRTTLGPLSTLAMVVCRRSPWKLSSLSSLISIIV